MSSYIIRKEKGLQPGDTPLYFSIRGQIRNWTYEITPALHFTRYQDAMDFAGLYIPGQRVTIEPSPIGVAADERARL